ncbi:hypothetical protein [Bowmanella denitrificans]|uniref:hypothetical protein n=1 Tax=Bowmanella denitrificans TaxID=366582 RepID=UPI0011AF7983|nr:hypothetical protein [Bowmanella denitrificans]
MQQTNRMFNLTLMWKQWQQHLGKALWLTCGFALCCALFALCMQFGSILFQPTPVWVSQSHQYFTLARVQQDGRLAGINRQALLAAEQMDNIAQAGYLFPRPAQLMLPDGTEHKFNLVYFSPGLPDLLGLPLSGDHEKGVYISEAMANLHFASAEAAIGQRLSHPRLAHGLVIQGILPASVNQLGPWQNDVFLSGEYMHMLAPFTNEPMLSRFLLAVPGYYGILVANPKAQLKLSAEALTERLSAMDLSVQGMRMDTAGSKLLVLPGIQLQPEKFTHLYRLWLLAIVLLLGLAVLLVANTTALFSHQAMTEMENNRIRLVLGADMLHLLRPQWLMAAIMLTLMASIAWLLLKLGLAALHQLQELAQYLQTSDLSTSSGYFVIAILVMAILLGCCMHIPLWQMLKTTLFNRQMTKAASRGQLMVGQAMLCLQLCLATGIVSIVFAVAQDRWRFEQQSNLPPDLIQQSVAQRPRSVLIQPLLSGQYPGLAKGDLALSDRAFDQPISLMIEDPRFSKAVEVGVLRVSPSYFALLSLSGDRPPPDWQQGVIVNQAAAALLQDAGFEKIKGSRLDIGFEGKQNIIGQAANAPHTGRYNAPMPMLYLPLKGADNERHTELHFYFASSPADSLEQALETWLQSAMPGARITHKRPITDVVAAQDRLANQLLGGAALIALLLLGVVVLNLYYQLKAKFSLQRLDFGIQLAVGAPLFVLYWQNVRGNLISLLVAIGLAALALNWLSIDGLTFSVMQTLASGLFLGIVISLVTWLPFIPLQRTTLASLLKQH